MDSTATIVAISNATNTAGSTDTTSNTANTAGTTNTHRRTDSASQTSCKDAIPEYTRETARFNYEIRQLDYVYQYSVEDALEATTEVLHDIRVICGKSNSWLYGCLAGSVPSEKQVSKIVTGKRIPDATILFDLRRTFGLDLNALPDRLIQYDYQRMSNAELSNTMQELVDHLSRNPDNAMSFDQYIDLVNDRLRRELDDKMHSRNMTIQDLARCSYGGGIFDDARKLKSFFAGNRKRALTCEQLFELRKIFGLDLNAVADVPLDHLSKRELLTRMTFAINLMEGELLAK